MVIFNIGEKQIKYKYPESAEDITLEQFIYFGETLMPKYPKVELEAMALNNQMVTTWETIKPYIKKLKIEVVGDENIYNELVKRIEKGDVKDNVKRFLPSLLSAYKKARTDLLEKIYIMDDVWESKVKYPYMAEVVSYFTGVPLSACFGKVADSIELKYLIYLYETIIKAINNVKELKYKQLYNFNDKVYFLPEKLMSKATLIEFAEAAQFDKARLRYEQGSNEALLHVIAVLLKPVGQEYSEEMFEQNCIDFLKLPLQVAYEVSFFLMSLSEKFKLDLQTSLIQRAMGKVTPLVLN